LSVANEGAEVAEQSPQIRANAVADKSRVVLNHAVQAHPDKPLPVVKEKRSSRRKTGR